MKNNPTIPSKDIKDAYREMEESRTCETTEEWEISLIIAGILLYSGQGEYINTAECLKLYDTGGIP